MPCTTVFFSFPRLLTLIDWVESVWAGLLEDLAVVVAAFVASTALGAAYAVSRRRVEVSRPVKQVVVLHPSDLPEQVDTRFSKIVLEAEKRVKMFEERVLRVVEGEDDDGAEA